MKNQEAILKIAGGAVIAILTAVIYHNAVFNGFVSDDGFQILQNPWIKDFRFIPGIFGHSLSGFSTHTFQQATYRPLMYAAFTVEHTLFGLNPTGWHVVNILIHGANGILVFLISTRLLRYFGGGGGAEGEGGLRTSALWLTALTAGALFVSHPAASEPVSWVSALPELSFTFLTLLAFLLHIAFDKGGKEASGKRAVCQRYVPGPLFFFLALLFKETAIALPVMIFIYDIISKRAEGGLWLKRVFEKRALLLYGAYSLAFALYVVLRILALGHLTPETSINAYLGTGGLLLNAVAGFQKAMVLLFLPVEGYPFQIFKGIGSPFEAGAILAILFTAVIFIALIYFIKKLHPIVLLALAIIILPIIPALYTPVITRFDFAPRYIYLSTAGYGLFAAFFIRWLFRGGALGGKFGPRGLGVAISMALIILCAFAAAKRSLNWRDNLTLSRAALRGSADNYYALYQIGNAEKERGAYIEAIKAYKEAIGIIDGQERRDMQTLRESLAGLGAAQMTLGRDGEAIESYETLLKFYPGNAGANYQLGYIYQGRGDYEKALVYYGRALTNFKSPADRKDTLLNMGNCYARLGRYETALESYREALVFVPGDLTVRKNMETLQRLRMAPSPGGKRP